jgi:hypothetical protein
VRIDRNVDVPVGHAVVEFVDKRLRLLFCDHNRVPVPNPARLRLTKPIPGETTRNDRLRKKVALAFTEDVPAGFEYRYKQSVALAEFWFGFQQPLPTFADGPETDRVGGTVYRSLQMRGDADNLALFPDFVHSSAALRQAQ